MADPGLVYAAVRLTLAADSSLVSEVSSADRIYQGWGPKKVTPANSPFIAITETGEVDISCERGVMGFTMFGFDVNVFGYNLDQVNRIRGRVKHVLTGTLIKPNTDWKNLLSWTLGGGPAFPPDDLGMHRRHVETRVIAQVA